MADWEIPGRGALALKVPTFALEQRRPWIDSDHEALSIVEQCRVADVSRSRFYYTPVRESTENVGLMWLLDEKHTPTPLFDVRRIADWLSKRAIQST